MAKVFESWCNKVMYIKYLVFTPISFNSLQEVRRWLTIPNNGQKYNWENWRNKMYLQGKILFLLLIEVFNWNKATKINRVVYDVKFPVFFPNSIWYYKMT